MQVRRPRWSHLLWLAAMHRHGVHQRGVFFFAMTTDGQHGPVKRDDMIIVVVNHRIRVDKRRRFCCQVKPVQPPVTVIDQGLTIMRPVWRF